MSGPSCYELALTLPALWRERDELDSKVCRTQRNTVERHQIEGEFKAVFERSEAIMSLIIETPAQTLQDVAAQLLVLYKKLAVVDEDEIEPPKRATISAFFAVAAAAGVDLDDIAFGYLAPCVQRPRRSVKETAPA